MSWWHATTRCGSRWTRPAWAAALGLYAADAPIEVFDYRPVRKQYDPAVDRDPYRVRATGGFQRGML